MCGGISAGEFPGRELSGGGNVLGHDRRECPDCRARLEVSIYSSLFTVSGSQYRQEA